MRARTSKLRQFSFVSSSTKNLREPAVPVVGYERFCECMNIIAGYRTMVLSEKAFEISPQFSYCVEGRTEDGSYLINIGDVSKNAADRAALIVNGNQQHMDRYYRDQSMELSNPGRGQHRK